MTPTAILEWKPKAKERPRFTKTGRTYTPKATVDAEAALAQQWRDGGYPEYDADQLVSVRYEFSNEQIFVYVEEAEDYTQRQLRGDLDNYEKLVNDALNKVAWDDDRQIVKLASVKL